MEKGIESGTITGSTYYGVTVSQPAESIEDAIRRIVREEIAAHEERPCSEIASNKKPYYGVEVKP